MVILLSGVVGFKYIPQVRALVMPTPRVFGKATLYVPTGAKPLQMLPELAASATAPVKPTDVATHKASPKRTLETPIRVNGQTFVIHTVQGGQTFEVLAETYATTPDVIRALNYDLKASLWANTEIIVAPGLKVATRDLPAFEAYQAASATNIDALAADLNVDPALLRIYNGCSDDCALVIGDWLMVPRVK